MLQPEPLSGHYRLVTQPKRQRKDTPTEAIQVEVLVTNAQNIDRMALDIHPGTFARTCVLHTLHLFLQWMGALWPWTNACGMT